VGGPEEVSAGGLQKGLNGEERVEVDMSVHQDRHGFLADVRSSHEKLALAARVGNLSSRRGPRAAI
jgi:hypothetical protein